VSIGNIVDGLPEGPHEFVVDELHVDDSGYLEQISEGKARYFHKEKMKTTMNFNLGLFPPKGVLSEQPGSEAWKRQVQKMVSSTSFPEWLLDDINRFINYYSSLISVSHVAMELRNVSLYETKARLLTNIEIGDIRYSYTSTFSHDIHMAALPFPQYCIQDESKHSMLQETLKSIEEPSFHQIQWIRTLNYQREGKQQQALLTASLTLESLVHCYYETLGTSWSDERAKLTRRERGLAKWIMRATDNYTDYLTQVVSSQEHIDYWAKSDCSAVVSLWKLRNNVVHGQKVLSASDYATIHDGIGSLGNFRSYLLNTIKPDLLTLEDKFHAFLDPIPLETEPIDLYGRRVSVKDEWRRECDCYKFPVRPE
jgi:hypothetical protein